VVVIIIHCSVCSVQYAEYEQIKLCYSEVVRLESFNLSKKLPLNLNIFVPQNVGGTDRAPLSRVKITAYSDILAKVPWGGVLWPRRLEHE